MKIMKTPFVAMAVGLGLLALVASPVQATGPGKLTVKLKRYQAGDDSMSGSVEKYTIDTAKVTTADILEIISEYSGVTIPDGSYLGVDSYGNVGVFDKNDNQINITNLDDLIYVDYGNGVWKGKYDNSNGKESSKGNYILYFSLVTGEEESVDVDGLAKESYSIGDQTKSKVTEKTSISAKVAGDGYYDGEFTTVEGTVKIKGKETYVND